MYNAITRDVERELLPCLKDLKMRFYVCVILMMYRVHLADYFVLDIGIQSIMWWIVSWLIQKS
jgi:hypothetical protein